MNSLKTYCNTLCFVLLYILWGSTLYGQIVNCPPNIGFEDGNYSNWIFYTGGCCPINAGNVGQLNDRHLIISGTGIDPYGGFPVVAPNGGTYSMKLGNNRSGGESEVARYYVNVPATSNSSFSLLYSYAVVFENPNHAESLQPRFEVTVFDSATKTPLPCNKYVYIASGGLQGFKRSVADTNVYYKEWTTSTLDLSSFAGTTVGIDFSTGDCGLGAHFGYGYFDVTCGAYEVNKIYCSDQPTVTLTAPPGFKDYEWRDSSTFASVGLGEKLTIPTPGVTTSYAIILTPYDGFGCPDTLYTRFEIEDMYLETTNDTNICKNSSLQLRVTSNSTAKPYSYQWSSTGNISCNNCETPNITPTSNAVYYVTVTDSTGCKKSDSVIVTVSENVYADVSLSDDTVCMFEEVQLENLSQNPSTADYDWIAMQNECLVTSGQNTPNATAYWLVEGINSIKLKITNGACTATDSANIYIVYSPEASFDIPLDICQGEVVKLKPLVQDAYYSWDIEEQFIFDTVAKEEYLLTWNTLGKKKIQLTVSDENGCSHSQETIVSINEYPVAEISSQDISDICYGKKFTVSTEEGLRYKYNWSPPQYFLSNNHYQVTGVAEKTGYVYLSVTNQWECTSFDSVFISAAPCCEIFMPDAFTPNGDGINDLYSSPDFSKHRLLDFTIAHRRGNIMFNTNNPNDKWDGTFNGQKQEVGSYAYYVKFICDGEEKLKKGTFTLLR